MRAARSVTQTPPMASSGMGSLGYLGPYGQMDDPVSSGPGKSMQTQHMGSVVGRRGAGRSQITGGDQVAHSVGHYGKKNPLAGLTGGGT
jgi:hypothetical protein